MEEETGIKLRIPISRENLLIFIAMSLKKGEKVGMIRTYISALREAHIIKGLPLNKVANDPLVKVILKGKTNEESAQKKPEKTSITSQTMRTVRNDLKMTKLSNHDKTAIWCVLSWLLLGSLRVSELLGSSKKKYEFDTMKTLRWDDVEILHESEGAKKVAVIRLHLRATKTE